MKSRGNVYSWLAVLGIFLLGGSSGLSVGRIAGARQMERFLTARPADNLDLRTSMVGDYLGLDADQRRSLRAVLRAHQEEFGDLQRTIEPQLAVARQREFDEIRNMLTAGQRVAFDRMLRQKQSEYDALRAVPTRP